MSNVPVFGGSGAPRALDDLTDVNAPNPVLEDVLQFDGTEWISAPSPGGGGGGGSLPTSRWSLFDAFGNDWHKIGYFTRGDTVAFTLSHVQSNAGVNYGGSVQVVCGGGENGATEDPFVRPISANNPGFARVGLALDSGNNRWNIWVKTLATPTNLDGNCQGRFYSDSSVVSGGAGTANWFSRDGNFPGGQTNAPTLQANVVISQNTILNQNIDSPASHLNDVDYPTALADADQLVYNSATGNFENQLNNIDNHVDVLAPSPAVDDYLRWNGTEWTNNTIAPPGTDVIQARVTGVSIPVNAGSGAFLLGGMSTSNSGSMEYHCSFSDGTNLVFTLTWSTKPNEGRLVCTSIAGPVAKLDYFMLREATDGLVYVMFVAAQNITVTNFNGRALVADGGGRAIQFQNWNVLSGQAEASNRVYGLSQYVAPTGAGGSWSFSSSNDSQAFDLAQDYFDSDGTDASDFMRKSGNALQVKNGTFLVTASGKLRDFSTDRDIEMQINNVTVGPKIFTNSGVPDWTLRRVVRNTSGNWQTVRVYATGGLCKMASLTSSIQLITPHIAPYR